MAKDHIRTIASVDWRMCIDDKSTFHPLHYVLLWSILFRTNTYYFLLCNFLHDECLWPLQGLIEVHEEMYKILISESEMMMKYFTKDFLFWSSYSSSVLESSTDGNGGPDCVLCLYSQQRQQQNTQCLHVFGVWHTFHMPTTWNNGLVQNWTRSTSKLYIVILPI